MSGSTLALSATMNSMLERVVKRTCPSAYWSAMSHSLRMVWWSICRCVPALTVQISSPPAARCISTPGFGWLWVTHLP